MSAIEVKLIPINQIAAPSYVRTQNGHDRESLEQLAGSIKAHGLLQPIVVRPADDAPLADRDANAAEASGFQWVVVAGRRRLAACKLAGMTEIPALVTDTDEAKAYELEIAENIQREQMTLADTARAVQTLMAIYNNAKTVCSILNKSPAWVSKHLSITRCPAPVLDLMDRGLVTDLETLLLLRQIAQVPAANPNAASTLARMMRIANEGNMNRQIARDALAKLKAPAKKQEPMAVQTRAASFKTVWPDGSTMDDTTAIIPDPLTEFALVLPISVFEKLETLGGVEWLVSTIEAAEPPAPSLAAG